MGRGRFDHNERAMGQRNPGRRPPVVRTGLRCWLWWCSEHPCLPPPPAHLPSSNRSEMHSRRSKPPLSRTPAMPRTTSRSGGTRSILPLRS